MDATATVVAACISFVAAVVAVVVGQILGGKAQRETDERYWKGQQADRLAQVGKERAREARRALLAAAAVISYEAGWARARALREAEPSVRRRHGWEEPLDDEEIDRQVARALDETIEIPDARLRVHAARIGAVIQGYQTVGEWSDLSAPKISATCVEAVDSVFGAYLREEPIPILPEIEKMVDVIDHEAKIQDLWAREQQEAVDQEARRARNYRQGARAGGSGG